MRKRIRSPFTVDYKKESEVIRYAKELGPGMTVYKHPDRENYNITHTSRETVLGVKPEWVIARTH